MNGRTELFVCLILIINGMDLGDLGMAIYQGNVFISFLVFYHVILGKRFGARDDVIS